MNFTPRFHKLLGALISILVIAIVILGVRIKDINDSLAAISLQRWIAGVKGVVIKQEAAPKMGTTEDFVEILGASRTGTKSEATQFFKAGKAVKTTKPIKPTR